MIFSVTFVSKVSELSKKKSVRPELVKDWILSSAASKQSKKNGTKMFLKKIKLRIIFHFSFSSL